MLGVLLKNAIKLLMQIKGGTSDNKYIFEVEPTSLGDDELANLGIGAEDNPVVVIGRK